MNLIKVKKIGLFLGPTVFLVLFLLSNQLGGLSQSGWQVISIAAWMVLWWVTEAVSISVTALLPLILFPMLGIFSLQDTAAPYASKIIFLFMGGFMIALGLEKHNLHTRIALNLIKITGTSGNGIILGFMIATAFLSMWISNTATAVMMLPIAISVVELVLNNKSNPVASKHKKFALALMLIIAYSANIGGMMTLIGTPPNVVFSGFAEKLQGRTIAFSNWLIIGVPAGIVLLTTTYFIINKWLYKSNLPKIPGADQLIQEKLKALGKLKKPEQLVLVLFIMTACGWVFKTQINAILGTNALSDPVTAMLGGTLMFIVPVNFKTYEKVLDWEDTKKLPWGILLLFGGGLTLANAMKNSGIIEYLSVQIQSMESIELIVLMLLLTTITLFLTELMSNVALTNIFIPMIFAIGTGFGYDPIQLAIPATLAASCAFMFPVSTPPNAIVFSSQYVSIKEMARAGILLNIISILVLVFLGYWLGAWI